MVFSNYDDDVEYKKIYDIEILKKYNDTVKDMDTNVYDDTLIDNINIYELENIVSNNIDNYYDNNIYHIVPIVYSIFFAISTINVIMYII
jgi:hypothetical protein